MRSHSRSTLHLSPREVLYFEQWAAFLVGIVCLAASIWAGSSGFATSGSTPGAQTVPGPPAALKFPLTVVVALFGMALVRFAFYQPVTRGTDTQQSGASPESSGDEAGTQAPKAESN